MFACLFALLVPNIGTFVCGQAEKRRAAERASAKSSEEKESLRRRAENAEECSREMDAERSAYTETLQGKAKR